MGIQGGTLTLVTGLSLSELNEAGVVTSWGVTQDKGVVDNISLSAD